MNNLSNMVKVAVVGGEGIGPEVTAQSQRVLNWFVAKRGAPMMLREAQYGLIPYLATGKVLPEDTVEAMDEADAILWAPRVVPRRRKFLRRRARPEACCRCVASTTSMPI